MPLPAHPRRATLLAELQDLISLVRTRQDLYLRGRGRYWQGLLAPAVDLLDNAARNMVAGRVPDDHTDDWGVFLSGVRSVFGAYRCDAYRSSTDLPGWMLSCYVRVRVAGQVRRFRFLHVEGPLSVYYGVGDFDEIAERAEGG